MIKISKLTTALIVLFSTNAAYASIYSNQSSSNETMIVGPSDAIQRGPHQSAGGEPGVGIKNIGGGAKVAFASLTINKLDGTDKADSKGIYTVQSSSTAQSSHSNMGVFHFAKVTDANVYFGDWAKTTALTDATHQSYYIGKDITTTLPTDNASYAVVGIGQYDGSNLYSGTFNVDFTQKKIDGSLANTTRTVELDNGNVYHANNRVTFSADAKEGTMTGVAEGAFFGNDAEALAGMIAFSSDHTKDIGFGGRKKSDEIVQSE